MLRKKLAMIGIIFVVAASVVACGGDEVRGDASPYFGGRLPIDIGGIAHGEGESEEESEEMKESDKEEDADASVEAAKAETSRMKRGTQEILEMEVQRIRRAEVVGAVPIVVRLLRKRLVTLV